MQEINIKITTKNKKDFDIESHVHVNMNIFELTECFYQILKELSSLNELAYVGASLKLIQELNH